MWWARLAARAARRGLAAIERVESGRTPRGRAGERVCVVQGVLGCCSPLLPAEHPELASAAGVPLTSELRPLLRLQRGKAARAHRGGLADRHSLPYSARCQCEAVRREPSSTRASLSSLTSLHARLFENLRTL